jgi:hypothetical protein
MRSERVRLDPGARASVKIIRIAPRSLDQGNLEASLKHVQDGVADALQVNDADTRIEWRYAQEKGKPKEYAVRVEIRV